MKLTPSQVWIYAIVLSLMFCNWSMQAQNIPASLEGLVQDKTRRPVPRAQVTIVLKEGNTRRTRTTLLGAYSFRSLASNEYAVVVDAVGFQHYETIVTVGARRRTQLDITLELAPIQQNIVVSGGKPLSVEPDQNGGSTSLHNAGLSGLPDDPDDFEAALRAFAGPGTIGAGDAQIFVNGLINSFVPSKESVQEVRINTNPFSAENDRPGANIIEVITKSGTQQLHGETYLNLDAAWWDARNPFTAPLTPDPSRLYGGNVSGPLSSHASFFLLVERTEIDRKTAVNATVLNQSFLPQPLSMVVPDDERRWSVSPRIDLTLNKTNTATVRYSWTSRSLAQEGIGGLVLPGSGYRASNPEQSLQLSETAVLNSRIVDQTRFQFTKASSTPSGFSTGATVQVGDAFTNGSPAAFNSLDQSQWELHNAVSNTAKAHTLRLGIRLRGT